MKQVKSSFRIVEQAPTIVGMKKQCEAGGRICYRSEDRTSDDSYKKLLSIFDERHHYSPLAHGTVYMNISKENWAPICDRLNKKFMSEHDKDLTAMTWFRNPMWTRMVWCDGYWAITTNYRVIKELELEDIMEKYWCEPTTKHIKRYSVEFECSRGVFDELARHSSCLAICAESTRYCNYDKDKFGKELTYVYPSWWTEATEVQKEVYTKQCEAEESAYMALIGLDMQPQQARDLLSLNIRTKCMFTGFPDAWEHVFSLRTTKAAHPDMVEIMKPLSTEFNKRGITNKIYE